MSSAYIEQVIEDVKKVGIINIILFLKIKK